MNTRGDVDRSFYQKTRPILILPHKSLLQPFQTIGNSPQGSPVGNFRTLPLLVTFQPSHLFVVSYKTPFTRPHRLLIFPNVELHPDSKRPYIPCSCTSGDLSDPSDNLAWKLPVNRNKPPESEEISQSVPDLLNRHPWHVPIVGVGRMKYTIPETLVTPRRYYHTSHPYFQVVYYRFGTTTPLQVRLFWWCRIRKE